MKKETKGGEPPNVPALLILGLSEFLKTILKRIILQKVRSKANQENHPKFLPYTS